MEPEQRIAHMLQNGKLSAEQAERLRAGLIPVTKADATPRRPAHTGIKLAMFGLLVLVVLIILVVLLSGGGDGGIDTVANVINQPEGVGDMNNNLSGALAIGLVLAVLIIAGVLSFNSLVSKEEAVFNAWAQVESTMQRRADLIPALVETVSGYVDHERDTLLSATQIRSAAIDQVVSEQAALRDALDAVEALESEAAMAALQEASARLNGSLVNILALAENYPDLRASDQFLELQAQLEGTENRINVARLRFNDSVEIFNRAIRRVPGSLMAGMGDFRRKAYFSADEGTETRPGITF